jgi:hypothetical protein
MSCGKHGGFGRWQDSGAGRWHEHRERVREQARQWWAGDRQSASTGNRAFDEYRQDTLRRLEEEQREFQDFLDRLRQAKDKAEFDQFMAERGRRQGPPPVPGQSPEPSQA